MDVTCNRCGTVYEFEEALISTTGTTVKCMQCGHLFKVRRRGTSASGARAGEANRELRWRVRRFDGSVHTLESLAELTQLIAAGQFARDDEISRTGQIWKRLGDIKELASVFEGPPRPRRSSVEPPPPPVRSSTPPEGLPRPLSLPESPPRARRGAPERFHVMGTEVALGEPAPAARSDAPAARSDAPPVRSDAPPATLRSDAPPATLRSDAPAARSDAPPPALRSDAPAARGDAAEEAVTETVPVTHSSKPAAEVAKAPARKTPSPPLDYEEEDTAEIPIMRADSLARRKRPGLWLVLGIPVLLALAGTAAMMGWWPAPQPPAAKDDHPSRELMRRGDAALASHLPARFEEAVGAYEQALAFYPDDAHILSSISRVYAVWSSVLSDRLAAERDAGQTPAIDLTALQGELRRLAERAKQYGERAAQRNPGNEEASVSLSDALRLAGNLVAARAELDRARATEGVAKAETLRVAALLAIDEAGSDYRSGRELAEQAVAREPAMIRARLLLARCLIADNDFEGARMHLDAAAGGSTHPVVEEGRAEVVRAEQAARKLLEAVMPGGKSGNGAPPAAHTGARTLEPAATATVPATKTEAAPASAAGDKPKPSTVDDDSNNPAELAERGEAALERGAVQSAERLFERALSLEPGYARARIGLGYIALERSQPRQAVNHFRPAARSGNPEALIGLGDAYRRLGRERDALASYQDYLKRYPRGERSSIAHRQVELLSEQLQASP